MQQRPFGRSGIRIAPLMLGGNVFGWTADESTSHAILDAFAASGCNAIDTADVYSVWVSGHEGGESETVLGNWLKRRGRRDDMVIATKVGMQMAPGSTGLSAQHIKQSAEASLKRLRTDYIDIYFAHQDDIATPLEESLSAFADLVRAGKVRTIAASNYTAERLQEALDISARMRLPRYEGLQPHYNLYERARFEADVLPMCARQGLAVVPYFALASGFLTGKYRSSADLGKSPRGGGMKKFLNPRGLRILDALDAASARLGSTPARIALAWLMTRPCITAPIASATSVEQLHDLLAATELTLDDHTLAALNQASAAE